MKRHLWNSKREANAELLEKLFDLQETVGRAAALPRSSKTSLDEELAVKLAAVRFALRRTRMCEIGPAKRKRKN